MSTFSIFEIPQKNYLYNFRNFTRRCYLSFINIAKICFWNFFKFHKNLFFEFLNGSWLISKLQVGSQSASLTMHLGDCQIYLSLDISRRPDLPRLSARPAMVAAIKKAPSFISSFWESFSGEFFPFVSFL